MNSSIKWREKEAAAIWLPILCALLAMFVVGISWERFLFQEEDNRLRIGIIEKTAAVSAQIEREIAETVVMAQSIAAVAAVSPDFEKEFPLIATQLYRDHPDIVNVAIAPNLIVTQVYPFDPNLAVIGLDYRTVPSQLPSIELARDTQKAIVSGPVDLVQGGQAFIVRSPVYLQHGTSSAEEFWGVVSIVVGREKFLEAASRLTTDVDLDVAIRKHLPDGSDYTSVFGASDVFDNSPVQRTIALPYGEWELAVAPKNGWPTVARSQDLIWLTVFGVGLMALLVLWTIMSIRREKNTAESRLINAIEAIDDGFALYDPQDRFVMCNSKYREIYYKSAQLFVRGTPFEDIIRDGVMRGQYPEAIGREEEWIVQRMAAHHRRDSETIQQLEDGRWLKISESGTQDGSTVGFRVDITELVNARNTAERLNAAKSKFLNIVSHELRTPLTIILGYNSFLSKPSFLPGHARLIATLDNPEAKTPEIRSAIEEAFNEVSSFSAKAEEAGKHLLDLIGDVLDYSAIDEGQLRLDRACLNIGGIINCVASQFRQKLERRNLALELNVEEIQVFADEVRLRQILFNLIGNAVKFTERGKISISTQVEGNMVVVSVSDTGIGIKEENVDLVFESFRQADTSAQRKHGGTGLGLTISRQLVEMQGGKLRLHSTFGQGSTFSFTIPLFISETEPAKILTSA